MRAQRWRLLTEDFRKHIRELRFELGNRLGQVLDEDSVHRAFDALFENALHVLECCMFAVGVMPDTLLNPSWLASNTDVIA